MFDTLLTRLFPPAMLGGIALYLLVTLIWLQPLVERRMAEIQLIPTCEAALVRDHADATRSKSQSKPDAQIALDILDQIFRETGLDQLPAVDDTLDMARQVAEDNKPASPRMSAFDTSSVCGCSVDRAYSDLGFALTLHVASARTYSSTRTNALPQSVLSNAHSGQCGALPWKKG